MGVGEEGSVEEGNEDSRYADKTSTRQFRCSHLNSTCNTFKNSKSFCHYIINVHGNIPVQNSMFVKTLLIFSQFISYKLTYLIISLKYGGQPRPVVRLTKNLNSKVNTISVSLETRRFICCIMKLLPPLSLVQYTQYSESCVNWLLFLMDLRYKVYKDEAPCWP